MRYVGRSFVLSALACLIVHGSLRAQQPELVEAFAFGSRNLACPTFNDPGRDYTMVFHVGGQPSSVGYDPARGWGYEVLFPDAATSPYGARSGWGIYGPFDDSPNNRDEFPDDCPEEIYDSFIGAKNFLSECSAATEGSPDAVCSDAEGIVFRVDVPNGIYRFVAAVGDADNVHTHRVVAEDGGSGPPERIGPNHVVLVENFDQAQQTIGETEEAEPGEGVFARVGFGGRIPPPGDGVTPSPQFVDMPESPALVVTQGYIRLHQLKGNSNDGPGGSRDPNGGDMVVLEIWRVGDAPERLPALSTAGMAALAIASLIVASAVLRRRRQLSPRP